MYVKYDFKSCVPCKEGYTPLVDESHLFGVAVDGGGGEYFFNYSCSCPCDKVSAFCNNFECFATIEEALEDWTNRVGKRLDWETLVDDASRKSGPRHRQKVKIARKLLVCRKRKIVYEKPERVKIEIDGEVFWV